jgi:uncharacterized protein
MRPGGCPDTPLDVNLSSAESSVSTSVAVVGTGIAGLSAAHGCREAGFRVTLFEAMPDLGMAAHSMTVDGGMVDVPLRIMSHDAWRSTLALAAKVGVETFAIHGNTSCSWADRSTWFRSSRMPVTGWPLVGSWRYLNLRALRVAFGLAWLRRFTTRLREARTDITLGDALERERYDPLFWRGLILPILLTICTCDEEQLLAWPAAPLLTLLHGILHTGEPRRLRGGTLALAEALVRGIPRHLGSRVSEVREDNGAVIVRNVRGDGGRFDRVIVATQANQVDFLDPAQFGEERQVLQGIPYASGELLVHRDERFMPRHQRDWTALNFQMDADMRRSMFSVWVNALEPSLAGKAPVFQTWNPHFEPADDKVLARLPMQRALVNSGSGQILDRLKAWHAQPGRRVFYCGSWAHEGVPLLESAVKSAQVVVDTLRRQRAPAG